MPRFLAAVREPILTTGKYLNVLRECGRKPPRTLPVGVHLGEEGWAGRQGLMGSGGTRPREGGGCLGAGRRVHAASASQQPCGSRRAVLPAWWTGRPQANSVLGSPMLTHVPAHPCPWRAPAPAEYDEGGKYLLRIGEAAAAAAVAAMTLLRRELGMAQGLAAFKRYFLTAQGDMVSHFMDAAEPELGRGAGGVSLGQLQALLELAVRSSSAAEDPAARTLQAAYDHRSILTLLMAANTAAAAPRGPGGKAGGGSPLKTPGAAAARPKAATPMPMTASERRGVGKQRTARESFILAYPVPWPLSIVAPEAAVVQYQLAFRHLFDLKWVDRELSRVASIYAQTAGLANRCTRAARAGQADLASTLGATLAQSYSLCQARPAAHTAAIPLCCCCCCCCWRMLASG